MKVFIYDIAENKRRNKVCKLLKDFCDHVQYSVFESDCTEKEMDFIIKRIKSIINIEKDSFKVYILCGKCENKTITMGKRKNFDIPECLVL